MKIKHALRLIGEINDYGKRNAIHDMTFAPCPSELKPKLEAQQLEAFRLWWETWIAPRLSELEQLLQKERCKALGLPPSHCVSGYSLPSSPAKPPVKRTKRLICACCNSGCMGRQWWNRDKGFGVCRKCIKWQLDRGTDPEEIRQSYGERGVHYDVMPAEPTEADIQQHLPN